MSEPDPKPASEGGPLKELSGRIGKYDILRPLGKGAMGMVYLAHDTILERDVALKVMVSQIADDPELNARFVREAKAVAKMTHPNVVNVYDLGHHTDGSPFIAMELLKGQDLQKAMRTPPPMPLDRKVTIIVQVLAGLAHAHQQGIVHRDIKPANIFINTDGTVKIMDFGVARLTTASMTGTGNIVGTADYMSPEQVKGAKVDGRSDLFSVGCMLYELVAGRRPFHSDNLMAIFYKITHEEPNFDLVPQGGDYDALLPILKTALAKDLDDRYQSAYDFAMAMREYLRDNATSASAEHALEGLLDIEAPPSSGMPEPLTDAPATTFVPEDGGGAHGATMEIGRTAIASGGTANRPGTAGRGTLAPTVLGTAPATGARPGTGTRGRASAPTVVREAPSPTPRPAPPPPQSGHPVLYVVLGGLTVALLAAGAFIFLNQQRRDRDVEPTPTTMAAVPSPTVAPPTPTTMAAATPPPTAAPPPVFAEAVGKGAAAMRAAQSAFRDGDYDRAIAQAQKALAEDPQNADARRVVENSLAGQKAEARWRAAEQAMRAGDFDKAMAEAEAGRAHAPWDPRAPQLMSRIQQAQQQAAQAAQQREAQQKQSQTAAQLSGFLGQAEAALAGQKYDSAIALYDEALKLDPGNQRAIMGKSTAIQARVLAQAGAAGAAGGGASAGRAFVSSKTTAQSQETRSGGSVPEGFEDSPGVAVRRGTQAADLPGKIHFDIDPEKVKAGDRYTVKIYLVNEGAAPIQIRDMIVTTKINGKGVSGPVPPTTKDVAPQQRALLMNTTELWKEDIATWTMEVAVRTARGERYTNQVTWK